MLLHIDNITKSFADKLILEGICLTVEEDDRIGLVGVNGAGKTTLLNLICGGLEPDEGSLRKKNGLTVGFLEQNGGLELENSIWAEMQSVFAEVTAASKGMEELSAKMSGLAEHDVDEYVTCASEYAKLAERFEQLEGYTYEVRIRTVLNGMGFGGFDMDTPIAKLSGGEKTRLAIAKLLLEKPDLLILDEPTNHLDFKMLMWLEDYLAAYKGAYLVVSHDRYFLDKTVTKIWELEEQKAFAYKGNYTRYKALKAERVERELKQYQAQQQQIASMEDFVRKNIARASTSGSAKSRVHALERMERLEKPHTFDKPPKLRFSFERLSVEEVLSVSGHEISVPTVDGKKVLAESVNLDLRRGDKVAVIGENGTGKTTFLRQLMKLAASPKGSVKWGKNVTVGYFDQENLNLNLRNTALEELWKRHPYETEARIRSALGRVLLTGDSVFKRVGVLSGGERAKLAFAVLSMEENNMLILDEPTNHLDAAAREVLEKALREFEGTVLLVSHDRYFLNRVPNKIVELSKDGFAVTNGNFDSYLEKKNSGVPVPAPTSQSSAQQKIQEDEPSPPKEQDGYHKSKKQRSDEVKLKSRISWLEKQMAQCEDRIGRMEKELALPENGADYQLIYDLCAEIEKAKEELEGYTDEWLELQ